MSLAVEPADSSHRRITVYDLCEANRRFAIRAGIGMHDLTKPACARKSAGEARRAQGARLIRRYGWPVRAQRSACDILAVITLTWAGT